jgi:hypothetical protein
VVGPGRSPNEQEPLPVGSQAMTNMRASSLMVRFTALWFRRFNRCSSWRIAPKVGTRHTSASTVRSVKYSTAALARQSSRSLPGSERRQRDVEAHGIRGSATFRFHIVTLVHRSTIGLLTVWQPLDVADVPCGSVPAVHLT